jgi:hypothetical protein
LWANAKGPARTLALISKRDNIHLFSIVFPSLGSFVAQGGRKIDQRVFPRSEKSMYSGGMKRWSILITLSLFTMSAPAMAAVIAGQNLLNDGKVEVAPGKLGTVVVFMSAKCPCSNSHVNVVKKLAQDFKDYNFVAVHSNSDESADQAKSYFSAAGLPFPVIEDNGDKLADEYKAFKTPHAFLIAADGKTVFKGGVTNSHEGETAGKNYLRDALADVQAGRAVKVSEARTLGCAITRASHTH